MKKCAFSFEMIARWLLSAALLFGAYRFGIRALGCASIGLAL
jgi:hypothetical protein